MKKFRRAAAFAVLLAALLCLAGCESKEAKFQRAGELVAAGKYGEAVRVLDELGSYGEAPRLAAYAKAAQDGEDGRYDEAIAAFRSLGDFRDSEQMAVYYSGRKAEMTAYAASDLRDGRPWFAAAEIYESIPDFRDSRERAETCRKRVYEEPSAAEAREARLQPYRTPGSIVSFGTWPQTEAGGDRTPAEWIVLDYDAENGKALLLSRYGLDAVPYNTEETGITWEQCTLRAWLNGEFVETAFTAEERKAIRETEVDNSAGQGCDGWNADGGNNTRDRVFLLSYAEAERYLGARNYSEAGSENHPESRVAPTAFAVARGAYVNDGSRTADGEAAGWWWLRSPGIDPTYAARVHSDGSLYYIRVSSGRGCVRPAMWIALDADLFWTGPAPD